MKPIIEHDVTKYVEENITKFHERKLAAISELRLEEVLRRKNPYLFKVKNHVTSEQIIHGFVDAHISSSEEGLFGEWLEGLAIFINQLVFDGKKSGIPGIDLEFDNNGIRYIVNIKSGPNWGNSSQTKKMISDFKTAIRTLRTSKSELQIISVNGCCYGKDNKPDKGDYFKYCGQEFWEFISGDSNLYLQIIEPLARNSSVRNEEFQVSYTQMINKFTKQFSNLFCFDNGDIDWVKLVKFNSEKKA